MKNIKYFLLSGLVALAFSGCNDLDLDPKGILDENALFGNEFGAKKYLSGIYNQLPIEDFNYNIEKGFRFDNYWDAAKGYPMGVTGEAVGWPWGVSKGEGFGYWPYERIREINTLIEGLPKYKANYTEKDYNMVYGEAFFLRAYYYFALAKRYGGVPLIDKVQDSGAGAEVLNVYRGTESATYKFIYNDLKTAMDNLPAVTERGRANKFVAAALMSRAMLYAGTIAKYGGYTTASSEPAAKDGYVGIPSTEAVWFFTEAYNAAKLFETEPNGYALYQMNSDKVQNYVDLFANVAANPEDIFVKEYNVTSPHNNRLKHSYDALMSPVGDFVADVGSSNYPTLETIEKFGVLPIENEDGTPRRFNSREELMNSLEPRLLATVYFSGMELRGSKFDIRRGLYKTYHWKASDANFGSTTATPNTGGNRIIPADKNETYNGERISGLHGSWNRDIENNTITGFFVRKYVNEKMSKGDARLYNSDQPWKEIRYAEVLLNRAEAAYELAMEEGNTAYITDAFAQITKIRDRAGATPYTAKGSSATVVVINNKPVDENLQFIRDERYRELLFENHRWWDIRRWRVAEKEINQLKPLGLMPYKVLDENKYIFIKEYNMENKQFNFEVRWYYEQIPAGELNKNPNLVQNPIY